ncbi:MAG: DNA polymerase III subunit delta [Firmicutes bacterium]|nr:DNA polymerase III subunit delta [Bacillota bacterium]
MGFEGLLGNERLKENLSRSLKNGHISHFYLISGPEGSGRHTLARLLAAAILCRGRNAPCLSCGVCRKVMDGNHPDFITVDDPEKKTVPVELIRQARADIYIQPNESDHKIYLFPRAQDMGLPGQNALLKVLEEPPAYGVFLLITDNPQRLLPTVRSRCTELTLNPLPEAVLRQALEKQFPGASREDVSAAIARSGGFLGQAGKLLSEGDALPPQTEGFAESFASGDTLRLLQTLVPMEKWKRDQLIPVLNQWRGLLESGLACRAGIPAPSPLARRLGACRSSRELSEAIRSLNKAVEYAQGNVSPAAVCGWLEWALRI